MGKVNKIIPDQGTTSRIEHTIQTTATTNTDYLSSLFPWILLSLCIWCVYYIYWNIMKLAKIIFRNYDLIIYENTSDTTILTIDDAPYTENSFESILNILKEYDSKATFFINPYLVTTDNAKTLLIRAVREGHHLGNHGNQHKLHVLLNESDLFDEIQNCQVYINHIYEVAEIERPAIKYYRPTMGLVNKTVYAFIQKHEYQIVLGSNFPSDPRVKIPSLNLFYITSHHKSNDIIILHDRAWTPPLLKSLLPMMKTSSLLSYIPSNKAIDVAENEVNTNQSNSFKKN